MKQTAVKSTNKRPFRGYLKELANRIIDLIPSETAAGLIVASLSIVLFAIAGVLSIWAGPLGDITLFYFAGFTSFLMICIVLLLGGGDKTVFAVLLTEFILVIILAAGFVIHFFPFMDHGSLILHTILGGPGIVSALLLLIHFIISLFASSLYSLPTLDYGPGIYFAPDAPGLD
ncbi:MAG: hypothetical protein WC905_04775 [Patescibacteria group bacterium]|jgi:hypothetical protein